MGIRETMNKNPNLTNGVTIGIIVVALATIIYQLHTPRPSMGIAKLYFSADDGVTWFADMSTNLPPFQHDGKDAVIAHVYKCADGKSFCGYLERLTPDALAKAKSRGPAGNNDPAMIDAATASGTEVKLPGGAKWVPLDSPDGAKVTANIKCPGGGTVEPVPDLPEQ